MRASISTNCFFFFWKREIFLYFLCPYRWQHPGVQDVSPFQCNFRKSKLNYVKFDSKGFNKNISFNLFIIIKVHSVMWSIFVVILTKHEKKRKRIKNKKKQIRRCDSAQSVSSFIRRTAVIYSAQSNRIRKIFPSFLTQK